MATQLNQAHAQNLEKLPLQNMENQRVMSDIILGLGSNLKLQHLSLHFSLLLRRQLTLLHAKGSAMNMQLVFPLLPKAIPSKKKKKEEVDK